MINSIFFVLGFGGLILICPTLVNWRNEFFETFIFLLRFDKKKNWNIFGGGGDFFVGWVGGKKNDFFKINCFLRFD